MDLQRPFMARFGDIAHIEPHGDGLAAGLQRGLEFDPEVRVTLKSGTTFALSLLESSDFDDGVRVWDRQRGVVDLEPRQILRIEFLPTPPQASLPERLYGTVQAGGMAFTGFVQWDRRASMRTDVLTGQRDGASFRQPFSSIVSIARALGTHARIGLADGGEVLLTQAGDRGLYVDDLRYGRVLVSWGAFERVEFRQLEADGAGPAYGDFAPGQPLTGRVSTRDGRTLAGRIVFDLDESETTETLDAPWRGVDYAIPFGRMSSIALSDGLAYAHIVLTDSLALTLERSGDLGDSNAGVLVFTGRQQAPEYVPWTEVARMDFGLAEDT